MRDAINSNPVVQAAVIGVLVIGAAFFFVSSSGGGEEEAEAPAAGATTVTVDSEAAAGGLEATAGATSLDAALSQVSAADTETPPLPPEVNAAWKANRTLVLLFVHDGGIDDRLAKSATSGLDGFRDAELFVVPAAKISRYAAITEGVGVDRVPALVVVTPKDVKKSVPVASVHYGYQSPASVSQAVIDAGYEGPTVDYHP
jgi:hypothetical protein